MKTTNVILIGVVGVGAVGAYMYMKNKQAQNALLSGSLPATTPSGTPPSGTAPSGTAPSGTAPSGTQPLIPTPNLTEPVKISGDANLDAFNLQQTLDELKNLDIRGRQPLPQKFFFGQYNPKYDSAYYFKKYTYPKQRAIIVEKLAKLGYKFDKGLLIKI
jgi:hypothetical protein